MDLRYAMRRFLLALITAALVNALLTGLFCPVVVGTPGGFWSLFLESQSTAFVPIWTLKGDTLSRGWLFLEAGAALLLGFGFWFVYPQFRPPPPPEP